MNAEVRRLVDEAQGCFEAAFIEGLLEVLYNEPDYPGGLRDLVERRLLHANYALTELSSYLNQIESPSTT